MQHLYSIGQKRSEVPAIKHRNFLVNIHIGQILLITTNQSPASWHVRDKMVICYVPEDTLYPPNSDYEREREMGLEALDNSREHNNTKSESKRQRLKQME